MHSLILTDDPSKKPKWLKRISLAERGSSKDEKWLQGVLFTNSELIPIKEINPGTQGFVPVCREFTIPKAGGSVFLDIFGVTPEGKLVLIECKLWRNPQARREVIAQILEYASLLHQWTFGDLSSRVKTVLGATGHNPLYDLVVKKFPDTDEANFVDQVSASLKTGDFDLIIAGDGIRSDVHAIADHLNQSSGLASRMALVEFQLWEAENDELIIMPSIPLKTEIIKHRVFVTDNGTPVSFSASTSEDDDVATIIDPRKLGIRSSERDFWQSFIDNMQFDHPDQAAPRHGGHGWVRFTLPKQSTWMTGYRTKDGEAGLFIRFKDDDGAIAYTEVCAAQSQLETDLGFIFNIRNVKDKPFEGILTIDYDGVAGDNIEYMKWLIDTSNKVVNTFRPFLGQIVL